jgi:hypothetical protein
VKQVNKEEGVMSLPYAESFRDLLVYQKAKALSKEIFHQKSSVQPPYIVRKGGGIFCT